MVLGFKQKQPNISEAFKSYLDELIQSNRLEPEHIQVDQFSDVEYWCRDDQCFKEFLDLLSNATKVLFAQIDSEKPNGLIDLMANDTRKAAQFIRLYNYDQLDHNFPALCFVNPTQFVDAYLQVDNKVKDLIYRAIERRYTSPSSEDFLIQEIDLVKKVLEESNRRKAAEKFTPSIFQLKFLIKACHRSLTLIDNAVKQQTPEVVPLSKGGDTDE